MIKNENILDAFVGETVVLHLASTATLPEEFVLKTLKDAKMKCEGIERNQEKVL